MKDRETERKEDRETDTHVYRDIDTERHRKRNTKRQRYTEKRKTKKEGFLYIPSQPTFIMVKVYKRDRVTDRQRDIDIHRQTGLQRITKKIITGNRVWA